MALFTNQIDFGDGNQLALAEYFIRKFNIVGRDAAYTKDRQTLAMVPRDTEKLKQGDSFYETLKIAEGWSGGPQWQSGNKYHNVSKKVRWQIQDPYAQYARLTFDCLALQRSPLGTLIDIKESESEDVKNNMLNVLEYELWNDGSGRRGQISVLGGTASVRVITLATSSDVYNFDYNAMVYGNAAVDGTGAARTNEYQVTDRNPMLGQITLTLVVDNTSPLQANDYLFYLGAANHSMPGIPTFIPATDPADTIFGVTRTGDPALSGWRFPFVNSISETVQRAFTIMGRWVNTGARRFVCCISTMDWLLLSFEREGRVVFDDLESATKWGLPGLMVNTPFGPITCVGVKQLGDGRGYILDWTTWKLYTLGNLPHVITDDGLVFLRGGIGDPTPAHPNVNGDIVSMQLRIWKVLLCLSPLSNGTFPTH